MMMKIPTESMRLALATLRPPSQPRMIDEHTTVDRAGLIDWTGETAESIAILTYEGVLRPDADGRFPLVASCRAIIDYWRAVIATNQAEARARR